MIRPRLDVEALAHHPVRMAAAVLTMGLFAVSCGSSSSAAGTGSMKLVVDETLVGPGAADVFVADEKGYFKDLGLDVSIQLKGSTAGTEVAAGHADVTSTGATGSFAPAAEGHPTKVIYELTNGPVTNAIMVGSKSKAKDIMGLSGAKVAVLGVGTSTYGAAGAYSKYIEAHGGKALQTVPVTSSDQQTADVVSGVTEASIGQEDIFQPSIAAGQVRVLLPSSASLVNQLFPPDMVNTAYWTLASTLQKKKAAFTAFATGLREADDWLKTATPQQIDAVLVKSPLFNSWKPDALLAATKIDQTAFPAQDGFISEAAWNKSLAVYKTYGLDNVNVDSSTFSYANHVDMSFWNAATPKVKSSAQ